MPGGVQVRVAGRVRRPAAFRTRGAFSVIIWFGPDRPQSRTSGVVVLPGGFRQRPPGCRRQVHSRDRGLEVGAVVAAMPVG